MFAGILVLAVGIIFLLKNLGYIGGNVWDIAWPIIVVLVGLSMIFRRSGVSPFGHKNKKK